ncbi:MAG: hypothetical protein ACON5A_02025 [Candidatus Comchoanobacterales bacterium]
MNQLKKMMGINSIFVHILEYLTPRSQRLMRAALGTLEAPKDQLPSSEDIIDYYQLYPEREQGKKRPETDVCALPIQFDQVLQKQPKRKKLPLAIMIQGLIPFPYRKGLGTDLTAKAWLLKYIEALNTIDESLHVSFIIGLNLKDDIASDDHDFKVMQIRMMQEANRLVMFAKKQALNIYVIPFIWGLMPLKGITLAQKVRSYNMKIHCHMRFPFSNARGLLLGHPLTQQVLSEMKKISRNTWHLFSDADVINIKDHLTECVEKILTSKKPMARMGSGYCFHAEEIQAILKMTRPELSSLDLERSWLLTELMRSMDNYARYVLAELDGALGYFSEPTLAINLNSPIPTMDDLISRLQRRSSGTDISQTLVKLSTPYHYRNKGIIRRHQAVLLHPKLQVSARHDMVAISKKKLVWPEHINGQRIRRLSLDRFRRLMSNQANHQLTPSQISSRWRQAGWGQDNFYRLMALLPTDQFPFVCYFLSPRQKNHDLFNDQYFDNIRSFIEKQSLSSMDYKSTQILHQMMKQWTWDKENNQDFDQTLSLDSLSSAEAKRRSEDIMICMNRLDQLLMWGWRMMLSIFNVSSVPQSQHLPIASTVSVKVKSEKPLKSNTIKQECAVVTSSSTPERKPLRNIISP